jgi:hypothetical protein
VIENGDNGEKEGSRRHLAAGVLLGALTVLLGGAWLWVRSDVAMGRERIVREEEKLEKVKTYIQANYETLIGTPGAEAVPSPLLKKPLLSIVKDVAAKCGIEGSIARVVEEENRKRNELTAKVSFKRIRIADLVNFLSISKREYPGLYDREARMRYARGGQADSWDVTLSLTAKRPSP